MFFAIKVNLVNETIRGKEYNNIIISSLQVKWIIALIVAIENILYTTYLIKYFKQIFNKFVMLDCDT